MPGPETTGREVENGVSIIGLVLAAGRSRRFGGPKLLRPLAGEPVIRRTVGCVLAAGLETVVVTGPAGTGVRDALAGSGAVLVENADADEGMASSIRAGVSSLPERTRAVVIVPGDQPTTSPALIRELCRVHEETGAAVVAPVYRGVQAPPVLFARRLFPELSALRGDRGARAVLEAHAKEAVLIALDEPVPPDVDTPEDHEALGSLLEPPA